MKKTTLLLALLGIFSTQILAQTPQKGIAGFQPYIGDWYSVPDSAMLAQFPEAKDMIGFRFEWMAPHQNMLRYYEGIPNGDLDKMILGNLVAENPRTGDVEFLGYQTVNGYLFKGTFEWLEDDKGFVRLYDVYYPHSTTFSRPADSVKGMISYRDVCHLLGKDTLECTVERLTDGIWMPWGKGEPFQMVRKAAPPRPIPQWVLDQWAMHTEGTGVWIADNSAYQSAQEPYDAYGMAWEWGLGKKNLKGRLFCMKEGKDVGTVWQFLTYWDPNTQAQQMVQIGSDGTLGQGKMTRQEDGSTKSREKFISPSGGAFESGHHTWFDEVGMHTESYNIVNGEWSKRRYYVWKRQEEAKLEVPEVYRQMAWLIGEWKSSMKEGSSARMTFSWSENQRMIYYQNGFTREGNPEQLESEGIITYHGTKDQIVFMNTYLRKTTHLISEGTYSFKANGEIHREFTCHYKAGDALPWSDGAKAPAGGKSIEFKQIWTPIDDNSFQGDFFWKKEGKWERPIKEMKEKKPIWQRI